MKISVVANKQSSNLEGDFVMALANLCHEVKFLRYNELNGKKYNVLLSVTSTRSGFIRSISSPLWLKPINERYRQALEGFSLKLGLSLKEGECYPNSKPHYEKLGARTAHMVSI